jgi:hypothetical protein
MVPKLFLANPGKLGETVQIGIGGIKEFQRLLSEIKLDDIDHPEQLRNKVLGLWQEDDGKKSIGTVPEGSSKR